MEGTRKMTTTCLALQGPHFDERMPSAPEHGTGRAALGQHRGETLRASGARRRKMLQLPSTGANSPRTPNPPPEMPSIGLWAGAFGTWGILRIIFWSRWHLVVFFCVPSIGASLYVHRVRPARPGCAPYERRASEPHREDHEVHMASPQL